MENDLATLVGLTAKYRFDKSLGKESDNYGRKKLPATINVVLFLILFFIGFLLYKIDKCLHNNL